MAEFPGLTIWTDAYIGDTQHLTLQEHGAYLKLLMIAWRSPGCCLPDDDKRIATMLGVTIKVWRSIKPEVMAFWSLHDGHWYQGRLTREREKVQARSQKSRDAADTRWQDKTLKNNNPSNASASPEHMPQRCPPSPSPSPEERKRDTNVSLGQNGNSDFDAFWSCVPRKVAKGQARKAWAKAIKQADPETIIAAMQRYAQQRRGQDHQFTKHPATWLNAECWSDEDAPTQQGFHDEIDKIIGGHQNAVSGTGQDNHRAPQQISSPIRAAQAPRRKYGPDGDKGHGRRDEQSHLGVIPSKRS